MPNLRTFPVEYGASLVTNIRPQRTDGTSIQIGVNTFERAARQCRTLVASGYSQGAAVLHNVIGKRLSAGIKNRIAGVVLFGDTRRVQDGGKIPNFPRDRVKIICNPTDGVCGGTLLITAAHLTYPVRVNEGANFLAQKIRQHGGGR